MGETSIRRWRRHGHDRLYISVGDEQIGWRDLKTGEDHPRDEASSRAYRAAVAQWIGQQRRPVDELSPREVARPATAEQRAVLEREHLCVDLSQNLPGASAEAYAERLRLQREAAAPVAPAQWQHLPLVAAPLATPPRPGFWKALWQRLFGPPAYRPIGAAVGQPLLPAQAPLPPISEEEKAWRLGAAGERAVAYTLSGLPAGWRVLHAIPVGSRGADIDHLVVGPAGIFTINSKNHPGKNVWVARRVLMVGGHRTDYLPKSAHEAERAARLLSARTGWQIPVVPVIAFVGTRGITVKDQPDDVVTLSSSDLVGWLRQQPTLLRPEHVEVVFAAARDCRTWHG